MLRVNHPQPDPLDLSLFFDALESSFAPENVPDDALFHLVARNEGVFPDWQQTHMALIGVPEERGTRTNLGTAGAAADIRRQFYLLKKPASTCRISDLGDLRVGVDLQETYFRVREVCETLLGQGVFPVLVGGSHDLFYGQYLAYQGLDRPVSVVNVDATLDIHGRTPADKHLLDLLTHEPNYLHSFCNLAHQSYLTSADALAVLEKLSFESFRLGQIRGGIQEMEPVLREADLLGFDITAIKLSDAPGNANAHAFGLTAEEACQLCWYAGPQRQAHLPRASTSTTPGSTTGVRRPRPWPR
jgi:formiminoglutamase